MVERPWIPKTSMVGDCVHLIYLDEIKGRLGKADLSSTFCKKKNIRLVSEAKAKIIKLKKVKKYKHTRIAELLWNWVISWIWFHGTSYFYNFYVHSLVRKGKILHKG